MFTLLSAVVFTLVSAGVMLYHGPGFLLLLRCQHLKDVLHHRDMRQVEVDLFGGDGLEGLLHTVHIHGVCVQEWPQVHAHRVDLGLEPNALFGMGAQQRLHRVLLALIESKLLKTLMEVCFEAGEAVGSMLRWLGQSW